MHALALAGSEAIKGQQLPPDVIGTWQVAKVNVDTGASRRLLYQHDDPRLKGRLFTIGSDKIMPNTPERISCQRPTIARKRITSDLLIKDSMGWRGLDPQIPTTKDYELPISSNTPVEVLSVSCEDGVWCGSLGHEIRGAWLVFMPNGQLALRWYDETILILERLPANAKPKASFNCAKAATPVEKTICKSVALASFDQSVAESYLNTVRGFMEAKDFDSVKNVKTKQKKWIKNATLVERMQHAWKNQWKSKWKY